MTIDPFSGSISDGKIYGRGASDTKGPMAAMLWGLRENAHLLENLPIAVDFVGFMGEESRQPGPDTLLKTTHTNTISQLLVSRLLWKPFTALRDVSGPQ